MGNQHPLYQTWSNMRQRCRNPNDPKYPRYGGRGITIDPRWDSFAAFAEDMGERPVGTSLDRINNDKGYSPDNCRWATIREQIVNRSHTRWLTWQGITLCVADWERRLGLAPQKLRYRLRAGWTIERALTTP
jgi:hypothetical protein